MDYLYQTFEVVRRGSLDPEQILGIAKESKDKLSSEARGRVTELGLSAIKGRWGPDGTALWDSKSIAANRAHDHKLVASTVHQLGQKVQKSGGILFNDKKDYRAAVDYLEALCVYAAIPSDLAEAAHTHLSVNDQGLDISKPILKALKELEQMSDMLKKTGDLDKSSWKLSTKEVKKQVRKVFKEYFDDIQREAMNSAFNKAINILSN